MNQHQCAACQTYAVMPHAYSRICAFHAQQDYAGGCGKDEGHGCPKCDTAFFPKAFLEQPFVPCGVRTYVHDTRCEEEQAGNDME